MKMSVDYNAKYGMGFEVTESDELIESEYEDSLSEYLYENTEAGFDSFEIGNSFTGEMEGTYLVLASLKLDGLDIEKAEAELRREMERLQVEPVGDFKIVGGIRIW